MLITIFAFHNTLYASSHTFNLKHYIYIYIYIYYLIALLLNWLHCTYLLVGIKERGKNWLKELPFQVCQLNGVYFKLTHIVQS